MLIWNWWGYAYPMAFMGFGTMLQEWFGHDSGGGRSDYFHFARV